MMKQAGYNANGGGTGSYPGLRNWTRRIIAGSAIALALAVSGCSYEVTPDDAEAMTHDLYGKFEYDYFYFPAPASYVGQLNTQRLESESGPPQPGFNCLGADNSPYFTAHPKPAQDGNQYPEATWTLGEDGKSITIIPAKSSGYPPLTLVLHEDPFMPLQPAGPGDEKIMREFGCDWTTPYAQAA